MRHFLLLWIGVCTMLLVGCGPRQAELPTPVSAPSTPGFGELPTVALPATQSEAGAPVEPSTTVVPGATLVPTSTFPPVPTSNFPAGPPTLTPSPTVAISAPVDMPAPGEDGHSMSSVAFSVGRNESGSPILWRRCLRPSDYADPEALCPVVTGAELGALRYDPYIRFGSLHTENDQLYLSSNGAVTAHYLVTDGSGDTWISPTLDGQDVLPWCLNGATLMRLYDFSTDPFYDLFSMDVLDYFLSPDRTTSFEGQGCES